MKKTLPILLAVLLVLALSVSAAMAEVTRRGVNFVDENNDGVCDRCPAANADGSACELCPAANADGSACELCPNGGERPLDGTGKGRGNRCGRNGSAGNGRGSRNR